ncbi:hypothetical protein PR048_009518 [Dryococelus australis]|uniref:Uncharacterized protein n=1 Tax=Dryococelus australis TaxID=614101 RepID=A0ABQ9I045_9NEOP|nr:hypothetical protein PR048_009518 [Dryococelus australis]
MHTWRGARAVKVPAITPDMTRGSQVPGGAEVKHVTRIRDDADSIPGPAILMSVFHGFPKSLHADAGAVVAERLARSPPIKANRAQSPAGSPNFRMSESNRTMSLVGGFSRGSPVSPVSGAAPYSPLSSSSALKTSLLRAAQISSLTHDCKKLRPTGANCSTRDRQILRLGVEERRENIFCIPAPGVDQELHSRRTTRLISEPHLRSRKQHGEEVPSQFTALHSGGKTTFHFLQQSTDSASRPHDFPYKAEPLRWPAAWLKEICTSEGYRRGSVRGDRDMRINSPIASKRKALNWHAVLTRLVKTFNVFCWSSAHRTGRRKTTQVDGSGGSLKNVQGRPLAYSSKSAGLQIQRDFEMPLAHSASIFTTYVLRNVAQQSALRDKPTCCSRTSWFIFFCVSELLETRPVRLLAKSRFARKHLANLVTATCGATSNEHAAEGPVCRALRSLAAYRSLNSRNFPIPRNTPERRNIHPFRLSVHDCVRHASMDNFWSVLYIAKLNGQQRRVFLAACYTLQRRAESAARSPQSSQLWSSDGMKGRGNREIPEKTRRPAASSGTIPHMRASESDPPGIEPGSP